LRRTLAFLLLVLAMVSGWAWYEFYFRWRDCFNEEGRCFDEASTVVYSSQSALPLGLLALGFLIGAALLLMRTR
jgi:hypothetical protein